METFSLDFKVTHEFSSFLMWNIASIKYCINIGKIECDSYGNAIVGALYAGSSECAISLKNSCYLESSALVGYEEYDIPGNYEISEIKALSTLKELVQQEIYKDFDFTNVWKISKYYPIVKNLDFDESLLEKPNVHEHSQYFHTPQ